MRRRAMAGIGTERPALVISLAPENGDEPATTEVLEGSEWMANPMA